MCPIYGTPYILFLIYLLESLANLKYMLKLRFLKDKLRLFKIFTDKAKRRLKEEEE